MTIKNPKILEELVPRIEPMIKNLKILEELVPRIRPMVDGETTLEYLNHIASVINLSTLKGHIIYMERSPVFKLCQMFGKESFENYEPEPFNADEITKIFSWIKEIEKIQNSLRQRIGTKRKQCFYVTWQMYEEGKSYKEIYEATHAIEPYTNDRRDAIKNIKTLVKNFGWKRKSE